MQKSYKNLVLAGAAMALALTPAMAGAQDQTMPDNAPSSLPQTGPMTTPPAPTSPAGPDAGSPTEDMETQSADTTTSTTQSTTTQSTTTAPDAADPTANDVTGSEATGTVAARPTTAAEKQVAVQTWPAETQAYYQSLTPERQEMFWALSDPDKVRLSTLPEDQRTAAWAQIEKQFAAAQG